jgi:mitochondrial fission protein ELM1
MPAPRSSRQIELHKRPLKALLLSDGKPGHYHLAEGVLAAAARLRPVDAQRLTLRRRRWLPTRALHHFLNRGTPPALVLRLGYGLGRNELPDADLVVSAGGETLAANAAAARLLSVPNIFCGRLRRLKPEHIRLVIAWLEKYAALPNHLLALPPSPFEVAAPSDGPRRFGPASPPRLAGALIGGNSGSVRYSAEDWERLIRFLRESHRCHGMRWLVTTSRRSGPEITDALASLAAEEDGPIERFIDYRVAGPGTLGKILAGVQAVLVTADSSTMITDAIGACLPTVGLACDRSEMEEGEAEFRKLMTRRGWYRSLSFAELRPGTFLDALGEVTPRAASALDELAASLRERLPELFQEA